IARECFEQVSAGHVRERLVRLGQAGLVARIWTDAFVLTEWGRQYLRGYLDASHQPRPQREVKG
ncbi:MAG: hypothetical protein ABEI86_13485, partial [Halobacteriaceae archaeon]